MSILPDYVTGNIIESNADFVVCPVNCVGTLGAGLAKQMKQAWPSLDEAYQRALRSGKLSITKPYTVSRVSEREHGGVILFPTKFHYKDNSKIADISSNLYHIPIYLPLGKISGDPVTIAFPKLGCGLGGLEWFEVKPHIESFANRNDPQVRTIVYV